jgi:hypothetical protein
VTQNFFLRLRQYYEKVGAVLRGEAEAASIFPNSSDIGISRERVYAEFLRLHAPSKCNVFYGGFLFDIDGAESRQLDIIVATDTAPRFNLHNKDGSGKSFSPVEGTLGVASIKSTLNKNEAEDALANIASIPPTRSLEGRVSFTIEISDYDDWPYKIIYAPKGIAGETLHQHVLDYYQSHPDIPLARRPHLIHVAGQYVIMRATRGMNLWSRSTMKQEKVELGTFHLIKRDPDLQGIIWALNSLQQHAQTSTEIMFSYGELINRVNLLPTATPTAEPNSTVERTR